MTSRRWFVALADANPFEIAMLLIAISRGVSYLTGYLPASIAERALPDWLVMACLTELAVGAGLTLTAILLGVVPYERTGLGLIAPSAAIYAVVLLVQNPHAATISFVIYGSLSAACLIRIYQLRRIETTLSRVINR